MMRLLNDIACCVLFTDHIASLDMFTSGSAGKGRVHLPPL